MIVGKSNPYDYLNINENSNIVVQGNHVYVVNLSRHYNRNHSRCPLFYDNGRKACSNLVVNPPCMDRLEKSYPELLEYTDWFGLRIMGLVGFKLIAYNASLYESIFIKHNLDRLNRG